MLKLFLKNNIKILISLFVLLFLVFSYTHAGNMLLEDYSGLTKDLTGDITSSDPELAIASYIDMLIKIAFGFASIGAVILIIWGGIIYTSPTYTKKQAGKEKIIHALIAILILVGSFMLFQEVNPDALQVRFHLMKPIATSQLTEIQQVYNSKMDLETAYSLAEQGYILEYQKNSGVVGDRENTAKNAASCRNSDRIRGLDQNSNLYDSKCRCWYIKPSLIESAVQNAKHRSFIDYLGPVGMLIGGVKTILDPTMDFTHQDGWYIIYRPTETSVKTQLFVSQDACNKVKNQIKAQWKSLYKDSPGYNLAMEAYGDKACQKTTMLDKINIAASQTIADIKENGTWKWIKNKASNLFKKKDKKDKNKNKKGSNNKEDKKGGQYLLKIIPFTQISCPTKKD